MCASRRPEVNAEIGSQFETRRYPDQLNRKAESFLNLFAI
jgi:hypothetical protein